MPHKTVSVGDAGSELQGGRGFVSEVGPLLPHQRDAAAGLHEARHGAAHLHQLLRLHVVGHVAALVPAADEHARAAPLGGPPAHNGPHDLVAGDGDLVDGHEAVDDGQTVLVQVGVTSHRLQQVPVPHKPLLCSLDQTPAVENFPVSTQGVKPLSGVREVACVGEVEVRGGENLLQHVRVLPVGLGLGLGEVVLGARVADDLGLHDAPDLARALQRAQPRLPGDHDQVWARHQGDDPQDPRDGLPGGHRGDLPIVGLKVKLVGDSVDHKHSLKEDIVIKILKRLLIEN